MLTPDIQGSSSHSSHNSSPKPGPLGESVTVNACAEATMQRCATHVAKHWTVTIFCVGGKGGSGRGPKLPDKRVSDALAS